MKVSRFAASFLAAVSLCVLCSSAQAQLTVTDNLILWLKADTLSLSDGAAVSLWDDSSPSNNDATQGTAVNQPTFQANEINGLPVVRFARDFSAFQGPDSDWMGTTYTTLSGGLSYFAVFRTTTAVVGKGYPGNAAMNVIGDNTGGVWNGFGHTGGKAEFNAFESGFGWESYTGATTVNDGVARDMIATFSPSDNTPRLFVNGVQEASGSTAYNTTFTAFNRIGAGFSFSGTGDFFDGDLAEILIYNTALSGPNRQSVHEYLVAKYALPEPSVAALGALGLFGLLKLRKRTA